MSKADQQQQNRHNGDGNNNNHRDGNNNNHRDGNNNNHRDGNNNNHRDGNNNNHRDGNNNNHRDGNNNNHRDGNNNNHRDGNNNNRQGRQTSTDIFSTFQQSFDKLFTSIKKSVPQYHQSVTNVQQECLLACENFANFSVALQQDFAAKTGLNAAIPDAAARIVRDSSDETARAVDIQNQVVLATIDAAQQNIKTFNDNAKSFADLNKSILRSWISAFTPRTR